MEKMLIIQADTQINAGDTKNKTHMKTQTQKHKTMPAREYYGDRPLWTPSIYSRMFADKPKKSIFAKILEVLKW